MEHSTRWFPSANQPKLAYLRADIYELIDQISSSKVEIADASFLIGNFGPNFTQLYCRIYINNFAYIIYCHREILSLRERLSLIFRGEIGYAILPYFGEIFTDLDRESPEVNMISYFNCPSASELFFVMNKKFVQQQNGEKVSSSASIEVNRAPYPYNITNDPWINEG